MSELEELRTAAEAAFGAWALFRTEQGAAEQIPHEASRQFLAEVGLPLQASFFSLEPNLLTAPESIGGLIKLGMAGDEDAWLDPGSGEVVCFFPGRKGGRCLINSSLPMLLRFLTCIEQHRRHEGVQLEDLPGDDGLDLAHELLEAMVERLKTLDPPAFEMYGDYSAWSGWLDDPFAWGGLAWQWESWSVEFLRQRGIDPAEHEPRRAIEKW